MIAYLLLAVAGFLAWTVHAARAARRLHCRRTDLLRKEGDRLIVEPVRKGRVLALLSTWETLDEPFPDVDEELPPLDDVAL